MHVLMVILYILLAAVSLFLIGVVLMQDSKTGGLTAAFSGVGQEVSGAGGQREITRFTAAISVVFLVLCLAVGLMKNSADNTLGLDSPPPKSESSMEAAGPGAGGSGAAGTSGAGATDGTQKPAGEGTPTGDGSTAKPQGDATPEGDAKPAGDADGATPPAGDGG